MAIPLPVTDDVVEGCLKCPRKGYLRLTGVAGQPSEYVALQHTLDEEGRATALAAWLRRRPLATVSADPPTLAAAGGADVITDLTLTDDGETCRFDALERTDEGPKSAARYTPVSFFRRSNATSASWIARDRKYRSRRRSRPNLRLSGPFGLPKWRSR